jgi:prepilin-type processing-associated H-X9-DG protein
MENETNGQRNKIKSIFWKLIIAGIIAFLSIQLLCIIIIRLHQVPSQMLCGTNMNGLGKALLFYVNDYDQYPTPEKWCDLLMEQYDVTATRFRCPGVKKGPCNYALNKYIFELGSTTDPNIVVLFEIQPGWNQVGGHEILTPKNHKGKGCNICFLDSHVEFVETKDIGKLKWKPD